MKLFSAAFLSEINTFSPLVTTEENFTQCYYQHGGNHSNPPHYYAQPLVTIAKLAKQNDIEYIESLCTGAQPAGPLTRETYEKYRNIILEDLKKALPVDIVFLYLHGAMVAEGYDDCEGDILKNVRDIIGPNIPVGVELDPHTHLTDEMLRYSTALVFIKEYPHIDFNERAHDLFNLLVETAKGSIQPKMSVYDCHMIDMFPTTLDPMRTYLKKISELEGKGSIKSISVIHGFPWGDVPDTGTKILVITDNDPEHGNQLAIELGEELYQLRGKIMAPAYTSVDAINKALQNKSDKPVVLADFSDNTGLGAYGDSTFLLKEILNRNITSAALSPLWDPNVVKLAIEAGENNELEVDLGGKGEFSGKPLHLKVKVKKIVPNLTVAFAGSEAKYGDAVTLEYKGVEIVVNSTRCQTFSTECFSKMGINPKEKRILIVKSSEHFRHSFKEISDTILIVSTPGTINLDFSSIPYKKLASSRQVYPVHQK